MTKKKVTAKPANPIPTGPAIHAAMSRVMSGIEAIGKEKRNQQQGFMFRGIDQAYNAIHPLLADHQIFTVPRVLDMLVREERSTKSGGSVTYTILRVEYDFISGVDGSKITVGPVMGEAMDGGDKGCNKCLAIAHKYALFQTFLIPTEKMDDPDNETITDALPPGAPPVGAPVNEGGFRAGPPGAPLPPPTPPGPPATAAPPPAPVQQAAPPPAPANTSDVPDDMLQIDDEEGAIGLTDFLIQLAVQMHGTSVRSLMGFWLKNAKVIDYLDHNYNAQYQRLKAAFTEAKNTIQSTPTDGDK